MRSAHAHCKSNNNGVIRGRRAALAVALSAIRQKKIHGNHGRSTTAVGVAFCFPAHERLVRSVHMLGRHVDPLMTKFV